MLSMSERKMKIINSIHTAFYDLLKVCVHTCTHLLFKLDTLLHFLFVPIYEVCFFFFHFTPQVSNWVATRKNQQSFLQWKPVCYFNTSRNTMTSTYVKSYKMITNISSLPLNSSLAYNFFATRNDYKMTRNIISFGLTEDKFYVRNDYTAW